MTSSQSICLKGAQEVSQSLQARCALTLFQKNSARALLRLAQQPLRVILQLFDLPLLARAGIKGRAQFGRRLSRAA